MLPLILQSMFSFFLCGASIVGGPLLTERLAEAGTKRGWYQPEQKKKLVIFMSAGGAGHISVTQRLCEDLKARYDITTVNMCEDILYPLDPIKNFSFGYWSGEDLYNYLLRHNRTWLVNKLANNGARSMRWMRNSLAHRVQKYLEENQFDIVISCMHFINGFVYKACEKLDVPFLIVTTDLNSGGFVNDLKNPTYKKFRYAYSFDEPLVKKSFAFAGIPENQTVATGFPVKKVFFEQKNNEQIKKDFNLPADKQIVMILMGGAGSRLSYKYVKTIARGKQPMHLLICIGRNEAIRKELERFRLPKHLSMSIVSFTPKIAELMAVSDILIAKAGSVSFSEAIYTGVPIFLDRTQGTLEWESLNYKILEKYNFGRVVNHRQDVNAYLENYLSNPKLLQEARHNLATFPKGDFGKKITKIVDELAFQSPYKKQAPKQVVVLGDNRDLNKVV